MTDKQIIVSGEHDMNYCEDNNCKHYGNKEQCEKTHCYYRCYSKLYTALKRKEQECEKLREYHNKCCEEFENEKKELLEKYNQLSRDFYSGKYCNVEKCKQLDQLKVENEDLKKQVNDLLNKPEIQDKILWKIDNEALLGSKDAWIYKLEQTIIKIKEIAEKQCVCGVDCMDMKQILQKITEVENEYRTKRTIN